MNISPYELETEVYSDNCSSCGERGMVYELRLKHGGRGNAFCIPLCYECFKKFAHDVSREFNKHERKETK